MLFDKTGKNLWIANVVLLGAAIALATIEMICDFVAHEFVGGGLSLANIILFVGSLILFIYVRKNRQLAIGTIVMTGVAIVFAYVSMIFGSISGLIVAYFVMCLTQPIIVLSIVVLARKKKIMPAQSYPQDNRQEELDNLKFYADSVLELKRLYDAGVLTEEEYLVEKQKMADKYHHEEIIDISGDYVNGNSAIIIEKGQFAIMINDNVVKGGEVKFSGGDEVTLVSSDGKQMTLKREGDNLILPNGSVYSK